MTHGKVKKEAFRMDVTKHVPVEPAKSSGGGLGLATLAPSSLSTSLPFSDLFACASLSKSSNVAPPYPALELLLPALPRLPRLIVRVAAAARRARI
ncbi:hypothetical protein FRC08_004570 [Ceratobasidium sp. 394]|nr:hypothetical protein FRC08_004570 [Ceratobasidium sp. 394]